MTETELAEPLILPLDAHNERLIRNVHPSDWKNPVPDGRYNLVVIGAGTAGLVSASGASGLGAKVALVERHLAGGDCLNVGCVPSKGLLRAARAAREVREAARFGVRVRGPVEVDFPAVMERMRRIRADLSRHDSFHRFAALGADVYLGHARFVASDAVEVDGRRLEFARAVLATGARAIVLPVPGLAEAKPLTNETLFWLTDLPRRLVVIGAGPIGCEMAQAFRRFGSEVTIVSLDPRLLPREDPDASEVLRRRFEEEGIRLRLGAIVERVETRGEERIVAFQCEGCRDEVAADQILLGVGRAPNVEALDLERAGIEFDRSGVRVDDRLRTTNPRVYAAGDICSNYKFTHAADAMARTVLRNAFFFGRARASALAIPWCTYTDPEIAHIGLYEKDAQERGIEVDTYTLPFTDVDRALLDGEAEGFARVHLQKGKDRILGATIVASHAGEMIGEIALALTTGKGLSAIGNTIHPYPTQAEAMRKLADVRNRTRLTPRLRSLLERYFRWRR